MSEASFLFIYMKVDLHLTMSLVTLSSYAIARFAILMQNNDTSSVQELSPQTMLFLKVKVTMSMKKGPGHNVNEKG